MKDINIQDLLKHVNKIVSEYNGKKVFLSEMNSELKEKINPYLINFGLECSWGIRKLYDKTPNDILLHFEKMYQDLFEWKRPGFIKDKRYNGNAQYGKIVTSYFDPIYSYNYQTTLSQYMLNVRLINSNKEIDKLTTDIQFSKSALIHKFDELKKMENERTKLLKSDIII